VDEKPVAFDVGDPGLLTMKSGAPAESRFGQQFFEARKGHGRQQRLVHGNFLGVVALRLGVQQVVVEDLVDFSLRAQEEKCSLGGAFSPGGAAVVCSRSVALSTATMNRSSEKGLSR
jgi:hypothetical protein